MKLTQYIQEYHIPSINNYSPAAVSTVQQDRWNKLADLTADPSIKNYLTEELPLPSTLTRAMADPRPCMITSLDDPSTIVNVNEAWCEFFGYTKDEAINKNFFRLVNATTRVEKKNIIDLITMRQASSSVLTLTTKEGLKRKDCMRFGTLALGADVGADYVVWVSHEAPILKKM